MLAKEIEEFTDLAGFALQYFDEFGVPESDCKRMNLCTPWRVINGHTVIASQFTPRIVDCNGNAVIAFGNQARHRGNKWAWFVALLIVHAVNRAAREMAKEQ